MLFSFAFSFTFVLPRFCSYFRFLNELEKNAVWEAGTECSKNVRMARGREVNPKDDVEHDNE